MLVERWTSLTGVFRPNDMEVMRVSHPLTMVPHILESTSLVALRVLAELLLHKDYNRLLVLMSNDHIDRHWRIWVDDSKVNRFDAIYAQALNQFSINTRRLQ